MILIFEGCDQTGKSTIASSLSMSTGIPLFKFSLEHEKNPNWLNMLEYSNEMLMQLLESRIIDNLILDRFIASEYVYAQVFREGKTNLPKIIELEKRLANLGAKVIYCFKPNNINVDKPHDGVQVNPSQYRLIHHYYEEYLYYFSACEFAWLDTTDENTFSQVNQIEQRFLKRTN